MAAYKIAAFKVTSANEFPLVPHMVVIHLFLMT
jgi:hypothetical protein